MYLKRNSILLLSSKINFRVCVCARAHAHMLSHVRLFATPWTVAASLVKIIREWSLWLCLSMSYVSCINLSVFRKLSEMVHIYSLMTSMTPKPSSFWIFCFAIESSMFRQCQKNEAKILTLPHTVTTTKIPNANLLIYPCSFKWEMWHFSCLDYT